MRRALPLVLSVVTACTGDGTLPPVDLRLLIVGDDMGPLVQNVTLARGSSAVMNALVMVNGVGLVETAPGQYAGQLPGPLSEGGPIQLVVIAGNDTVTGIATVPRSPNLIAPTGGTEIHNPVPVDFAWSDMTDPDGFVVGIQYPGGDQRAAYGPTFRSGIVISSRLPKTSASYSAYLLAYNDGTFTGPAHPNSRMRVRQTGGTASLIYVP